MLSPKQEAFLRSPLRRINLLYGSVRSGKTWISLLSWALWVGRQPIHQQFLMVGKTITTLKRNCLGLLETLIGDNITYSTSQKRASIFGRTVWLEGANDERSESKIRGMTLRGAYIDELTQIPKDFYMMTLSRLSEAGAALIATTNPDNPNHYVKTEIIDNPNLDKQVLKFLLDDNTDLDETYKENLKREYTGVYYSRFILGDFVRAKGIIFPTFADDPSPWIVTRDKLPQRFRWCEGGFDIGGNGSAYALTASALGSDGIYYVLKSRKVQAADQDMADLERLVQTFFDDAEKKYHQRVGIINCDHVAVVVNSINDHTAYRADLCYKPPLEDRPFAISKLLAEHRIAFVAGECDDLIDELRNLVFDDKSERAIPLDDGSMQIDTWDSFIYSLSGNWDYVNE